MFRAQQEQVIQEANIGIIEIRNKEIDFHTRVCATLGTQAALVGGFAYLTFSQNLDARYKYVYYFNIVYCICAGMAIVFAIHVILTSMLVQLMGPGLALNGPVGSMARAAEGMRAEQVGIQRSFFMMMFFFAVSTLLLFWVTMEFVSACVSSAGFLICAYSWLGACRRIFYRFDWDKEKQANQTGRWRSSEHSSPDEPVVPIHITQNVKNPAHADYEEMEEGSGETERPSLSARPSFVERMSNAMLPRLSMKNAMRPSMTSHSPPGPGTALTTVAVNPKATAVEGFLVMNVAPKELKKIPKQWERRYVVLNYRGQMSYYKTRQDFRSNPAQTINPRPLSLDDFFVTTERPESETATITSTGDVKVSFTLIPRDDVECRSWIYRTDTEEELEMWVSAMLQISPSSFRSPV